MTNRTFYSKLIGDDAKIHQSKFFRASHQLLRLFTGDQLEEFALATPPLLPQEQWAPASKILHSKELFTFRNGEVQVPQAPGLGLDFDEEAIEHYRV